ncbi:anthranilate synthase component I [candidate division KSB1 bacterium]|nr:anthranilate synthase component I [candidate division KSB1 bacterium]
MQITNLFSKKISMKTYEKLLLADMDTPVSSFFKLGQAGFSFLLESMEGDGRNGRYSIIGMNPLILFKRMGDQSWIIDPGSGETLKLTGNPFDHLKMLLAAIEFERDQPFECGFFCGYWAYDTIRYIEDIPQQAADDLQLPEIILVLPSEVVIFDNYAHTLKLIVHLEDNGDSITLQEQAFERLTAMLQKFSHQEPALETLENLNPEIISKVEVNISNDEYFASLAKAKTYIRNGDIFQVVLSRRFQTDFRQNPFDIYRMLHLINPSPYMYYLDFQEFKIIGSSPETLVRYDGEKIMVKPIAGTRKRGETIGIDQKIAAELLKDEKELAEHDMLVDLGRNDVGRVARYGSIKVEAYRQVENYSHVMHIVTTVTGELQSGLDAVDVFKACFPAGTVSGAPKVRAMQIIDELEKTARGPYAGAIGYFDCCGRMDTCITIRTIWVKNQMAYWQAGGGIVADSVPENELAETENKARALLKAILLAKEVQNGSGH